MPEGLYNVLALGMRYWFAFLGVLIVWRSFRWLFKDRRAKHARLRELPDAGMVGELYVLQGSYEMPQDSSLPLPYEGVLGYVRTCDVVVPCTGVAAQHLDFSFCRGEGLRLMPRRHCQCVADGEIFSRANAKRQQPLRHGSILQVGDAVFRVRLFMGVDAGGRAVFPEEQAQQPAPWEAQPGAMPPWQGMPVQQPYEQNWPPQNTLPPWQGQPPQQNLPEPTWQGQQNQPGWQVQALPNEPNMQPWQAPQGMPPAYPQQLPDQPAWQEQNPSYMNTDPDADVKTYRLRRRRRDSDVEA